MTRRLVALLIGMVVIGGSLGTSACGDSARQSRSTTASVESTLTTGLASGFGPSTSATALRTTSPTTTSAATSASTSTSISAPDVPAALVPWTGPVEHLFFHTLVVNPSLAFTHDRLAKGFRDYFVTVKEFRAVIDQLYANGWTLVDLHRVVAGTVRVPRGRRPVVISEDDVNYYDYGRPRGLGWRLVLDAGGAVQVELHDGNSVRVTDDDLIPIVNDFVARHPDFSAEGAKGVLALTGYQGVFGERVQDRTSLDYAASLTRARAMADRLKATGWILANHTYGHIDLSSSTPANARRDIERWKAEEEPVLGATDILVYPFGGRPPIRSGIVQMLRDKGYVILCDIDVEPRLTRADGVTVMSRRHIDGLALEQQRTQLAALFDTTSVEDRGVRAG